MVCDIENGTKSPTIDVLSAIAESFGVRLSDLVAEADAAPSPVAIRRKEGSKKLIDARGIERRQLAPDVPGGSCEMVQITIPAHTGTGALAPHAAGTTEYVSLVRGSLVIRVGNQNYELQPGDCIGFQTDQRHAYTNKGSSGAVLYVVIEHKK